MDNLIKLAIKLRSYIEKAVVVLEDSEALEAIQLFPQWSSDEKEYETGDRVRYENILYKCLYSHTSNSKNDPSSALDLWEEIILKTNEIIEWDSTNQYQLGDKVMYNEKIWESTVNNNMWPPGTDTFWIESNV